MGRGEGRLFVTGGSSYLGRCLVPLAVAAGYEVVWSYFSHPVPTLAGCGVGLKLDVRDGKAVDEVLKEWRPRAVIHLAGSNRTPDMETVIVRGSEQVARGARAVGARLIHLSTDVIFDGQEAPYKEADVPRPLHAYGRAKVAAEQAVAREQDDFVIVRTSLIYGRHAPDHGTRWVREAIAQNVPVTLFDNQWRNPIAAETLSRACLELVGHGYGGVLHVAGEQVLSRADFGLNLLSWWLGEPVVGLAERWGIGVGACPVDAPWPLDTTLGLAVAKRELVTPLLGVGAVLAGWRNGVGDKS